MNDDKHMLKVVQHATASALNNQEATATFLLLPNWMENSTNAPCAWSGSVVLRGWDTTLDTPPGIPTLFTKPSLTARMFALILESALHAIFLYQQSKTPPLPEATWAYAS